MNGENRFVYENNKIYWYNNYWICNKKLPVRPAISAF